MYKILYYCHDSGYFYSDFNLKLNELSKYKRVSNNKNIYKIINDKVIYNKKEYSLYLLKKN